MPGSNPQPVKIHHQSRLATVPDPVLQKCAVMLYKRERMPLSQAISLVFCSDRAIHTLNARYRRIDRPTDVLSFTLDDPDLLGEIYISVPRAIAQARRFGCSLEEEILRLFIHGFFHLAGYDHQEDADRQVMEKKEAKAMDGALKMLES